MARRPRSPDATLFYIARAPGRRLGNPPAAKVSRTKEVLGYLYRHLVRNLRSDSCAAIPSSLSLGSHEQERTPAPSPIVPRMTMQGRHPLSYPPLSFPPCVVLPVQHNSTFCVQGPLMAAPGFCSPGRQWQGPKRPDSQ